MSPKSNRRRTTSPKSDAPQSPPWNESQQDPRRSSADTGAPPSRPAPQEQPQEQRPEPPAAEQWREHEHQAAAADLRAAQLLQETGSPELAKHAVDQAQTPQSEVPAEVPADEPARSPSGVDQDDAARQFGYESFEALVKDAVPFPVDRGEGLMVCELKDGRWIRFDRQSWPKHEIFRSRDEAMRPTAPG